MNIVIIGAGLPGASAAHELRSQGHSGDITLIGAEPHPPYERPPLSMGLLLGSADPDSVFVHPTSWYADNQIDLVTGSPVTDIDLGTGHVTLGDRQLSYHRLLLATGAQPRRFPMADQSGADITYLRNLDDALPSPLGSPNACSSSGRMDRPRGRRRRPAGRRHRHHRGERTPAPDQGDGHRDRCHGRRPAP
jgi:NADPH-dependent 2,4-dienoyl-CoA reductase/sulfur reductase-like enzyme